MRGWRRRALGALRLLALSPMLLSVDRLVATPIAAPYDPRQVEQPSHAPSAESQFERRQLHPTVPQTIEDPDPLNLAPELGQADAEWLTHAPEDQDLPSASVRNLFADLPLHPAFPGQGLNFEPKPQERLDLPSEAHRDDDPSRTLGEHWQREGKTWLMENADAEQIAQVKAWRGWMVENRALVVVMGGMAIALVAGLWMGQPFSKRSSASRGRSRRRSRNASADASAWASVRQGGSGSRTGRGSAGRRSGAGLDSSSSAFGGPGRGASVWSDSVMLGDPAMADTVPADPTKDPRLAGQPAWQPTQPLEPRHTLPSAQFDPSLRPRRRSRGSGRTRSRSR